MEHSGLDLLGAEEGGVPGWGGLIGPIVQAAGGIAQGGLSIYEQQEKEKKAKAESASEVAAAIRDDAAAASALANAAASTMLKRPTADIDQATANAALSRSRSHGPSQGRADAAQKALDAATAAARKNPKDAYKMALARAWVQIANVADNALVKAADQPKGGDTGWGESWWTRPAVGKIPGWGVVAGGGGVLVGLGLAIKKWLL